VRFRIIGQELRTVEMVNLLPVRTDSSIPSRVQFLRRSPQLLFVVHLHVWRF